MKQGMFLLAVAAMTLCAAPAMAQHEQIDQTDEAVIADEVDFTNLEEDEALEALRTEIEAEFGILGELFKADPLTPEQEALLPMAKTMTDRIFPEGTFGTVMKDAMDPLMGMVMGAVASDPRTRLVAVTGLESDHLADLTDEDAQEALDIFDPGFGVRTKKIGDVTVEMIGRLFDAIEPSYRDGMARALTTRFDEAEMVEALAQLDNPVVAKLTQQSFLVQYDPQMMSVMEQIGPALIEVMPGMMEEFEDLEAELADEGRLFTDLSASERQRAARLLGKSERELDALAPVPDADEDVEEDGVI